MQSLLSNNEIGKDCHDIFSVYTLLNKENVYYSLKDIASIYGDYLLGEKIYSYNNLDDKKNLTIITPIDSNRIKWMQFINVIRFMLTPRRIALHEIIIAVTTQLQIENEKSLHQIVVEIKKFLSEKIEMAIHELNLERKKFLSSLKNSNQENYPSTLDLINLDEICYQRSSAKIKAIVEKGIVDFIQSSPKIQKIELPNNGKRIIFMFTGGPASGKTTFVPMIKRQAEEARLDWKNFVKVNADYYQHLLLDPQNYANPLHAQMVIHEAVCLKMLIIQRLKEMQNENQLPYIIFDQNHIVTEEIDYLLLKNSSVEIFVLTTDVKNAIDRASKRCEETGRCINARDILKLHKIISGEFYENLALLYGKKIILTILDNSDESHKKLSPILRVDLENGEFILFNEAGLNKFLFNQRINMNATSSDNIFLESLEVFEQSNGPPLAEWGFFKTNYSLNLRNEEISVSSQYNFSISLV